MVLESLGTPVGILSTETYQTNAFISAQDVGFTRERKIVICDLRRVAYSSVTPAPAAHATPAGSSSGGVSDFFTRTAIDANRAANGRIAAMITHFGLPPLSPVLLQRLEPGEASRLFAAPEQMWIPDDHWRMSAQPVIDQALWAAIGPLTEDDKNPPPIAPVELGPINYGVIEPAKELTFTAPSYKQAVWEFLEFAKECGFSDGMALIPPTPELVDEMLAATTRDRNDVIGAIMMRGGAITIENLAINAVMCGLNPEAFPVYVAAGEAVGQGWEENHAWWHIMTGNTHELALVVSGPVVEEIGMSTGLGQAGAGNEVNDALGRSVRMLWRNIARNIQPNLDITDRSWRQIDPMIITVAENYQATREVGWPTHSETLGFGNGSSSVTLVGVNSTGAGLLSSSTGWQANWTATALANLLPTAPTNLANSPGASLTGTTAGFIAYSPAQARLLASTYASKQALIDSRAHALEISQNDPSNPSFNPADPLGVTGNLLTLRYPIIIGEDPDGAHTMLSGFHLSSTFMNQKVTGAALPGASAGISEPTAPSAPRNFVVQPLVHDSVTNTYSAKLTWDAPLTDGGSAITRYEVYYLSGHYDLAFRWLEVPGGAAAREVTFTNLLPGVQYEFKVRARNNVNNSMFYTSSQGEGNMGNNRFNERYPIRTLQERIDRMGGRGGWAVSPPVTPPGRYTVINSNRYPQIQGQDGPGIKLYYGDPNRGAAGEMFYGPNGEIWNYLGERVDRAYDPGP